MSNGSRCTFFSNIPPVFPIIPWRIIENNRGNTPWELPWESSWAGPGEAAWRWYSNRRADFLKSLPQSILPTPVYFSRTIIGGDSLHKTPSSIIPLEKTVPAQTISPWSRKSLPQTCGKTSEIYVIPPPVWYGGCNRLSFRRAAQ